MDIRWFKLNRTVDKEIISLAWPSITEQVLEMFVGMASTMFMAWVGTEAIAAVAVVNMLMAFLQTVFSGLAIGTTVIIARVTGEGNKLEAKNTLVQSGYMAIVTGILLLFIGKIFSFPILTLFLGGAEANVFNLGFSYFSIVLFGLPFFVLDIIVSGAMRGAGDMKTPMKITGGVNILNIILNIMLIFGVPFLHIPALGVVGSAIAVTISRIVGVTARILVLYIRKGIRLNMSLKDDYSIRPQLMKRIINIGIPGFIEQAVLQGGFLILQVIIVTMGTVAMAAYQIGMNINALVFFPIFGFAIANTTLVGQSLGEKKYDRAHTYAYESLKITIVIGFIMGVLMFVFAPAIAGLYTRDPEVIRESLGIVRTLGVLEPLLAILNVCSSTLKAAGDIKYVMITSFVGLWTLRVLPSFAINKLMGLGLSAVMIGIVLDFSARSVMYLIRMNKGKWKHLKV